MKIGTIAHRLGTTVRTLRFYEEQGLVHPRRTPGGTRLYDQEDEKRFAAMLALARLGFSLDDLKSLSGIRAASRSGDAASREVTSHLKSMDADLEAHSLAIEQQRADIQRAQAFLRGCHGCQRKPTRTVCDNCEVSAGISDITVMRVIWDERSPD